ncbi:26S proteasome regulatory subunit N11 [Pancytospora philotis]|nr:26S proteasome regulatory subunit N11 [Pancytospora philotis]
MNGNGFYNYEIPAVSSPDTSETIQISSLALLKMMKHGRAGIPLEVMGLMLGEFIDEYNVRVVDVFAMPQSGTGVTVEAVDPVFQTTMMETLKLTGRHETVVGWYHSHPGFGCWLSSTDVSTQSCFEQLCKRAVAVVIDPIQSVKGKVVIDAFRNINTAPMGGEPRITTSNIGFLKQPSFISLVHGLNKSYYSFNITFRKNELEKRMLLSLNRKSWACSLKPADTERRSLAALVQKYSRMAEEERKQGQDELGTARVGQIDHRKHLLERCNETIKEEAINNLIHGLHAFIFNK